jgi:hypothetical protein
MFEEIRRNCNQRGSCFRSLNAVATQFQVNAEMKVLLELLSLLVDIWRGGVKILRSRAEILCKRTTIPSGLGLSYPLTMSSWDCLGLGYGGA